jgi:hypothetical protein
MDSLFWRDSLEDVSLIESVVVPSVLLNRHGDGQAFLGRDEVIEILGVLVDVDFDPVHLAAELLARRIVVGDWRTEFVADVTGLVGGKDERLGLLHATFAGLLAVHVQRHRDALR